MSERTGLRRRLQAEESKGDAWTPVSTDSKKRGNARDELIEYKDLLEWQKDNEFIIAGYRPACFSYSSSFGSVWRVHNETINIWSHGLGSVAFSFLPTMLYLAYSDNTFGFNVDRLMLFIFFASVTVCFVFSATFHTLQNHSQKVWHLWSTLDHLGIVIVIWGSTIPSAHFGFHDDHVLRNAYWAIASSAAAGSAYATLQPVFRTPQGRRIRVGLYSLLGLSAFASAVHGVWRHGFEIQNQRMSLNYFMGLGLLNFTGAALYGARIPERLFPGKFDYVGSGHQLMHILVMFGALSHTIGLLKAYKHWHVAV